MREIKFRAWGNEFDRTIPEYQMYPVTKIDMTITGDKIYRIGVQRPLGKEPTFLADDYKLMQYTGLKDKNGTGIEAYEGDIVQRRDGKQGEIIWHQDSCGFAIAFGDDEPLGSLSSWFEVVGNKYDN